MKPAPLTAAAVFVDPEDLHQIRSVLAADGVEVIPTAEVEEAVQAPAEVILLDADGHRAWANALHKAVELRPTARVVVLARQADERMWVEVLSQGAYDLLPKPFRPSEVRSAVLGALRRTLQAA